MATFSSDESGKETLTLGLFLRAQNTMCDFEVVPRPDGRFIKRSTVYV